MTDTALPIAPLVERDFRLGNVFNRSVSVLSRNFLPFFVVMTVANVPSVLLSEGGVEFTTHSTIGDVATALLGALLVFVVGTLGQAVVVHGAFQDMCGRPVRLVESLKVGMSRLVPLIGLSVSVGVVTGLAFMLLIVPGFVVMTMLAVTTPVCVVEQLLPFRSMERSSDLTKGHRWGVFSALVVLQIPTAILSGLIEEAVPAIAGPGSAFAGSLIGNGISGTILAVVVFVIYHDLRVVQEGVDTDQIASVFE